MPKITMAITALFIFTFSFAQQGKKQEQEVVTKMDKFASKTGTILKFIDYKLPLLKGILGSGASETRIRAIIEGNATTYFYQIVKKAEFGDKIASIEYSDLVEVIKATKSLRLEFDKDLNSKPDYLENKFVTEDGFEVGYYVSTEKSRWYLSLEKYGSGNSIFINDVEDIESAFSLAKEKIDSLKK